MRIDQSTLSGESHPVHKTREAVLRDGLSRVEDAGPGLRRDQRGAGTGKAVAFATGMESEFGKIAHMTQDVGEELSPLQARDGPGDHGGHYPCHDHRCVLLCAGDHPGRA